MYIHERNDWPDFQWDYAKLIGLLSEVRYLQGRLLGRMQELGFELRESATLQTLTMDVTKTSEIEGEKLNDEQVRSSLAKRLGIQLNQHPRVDRHVEGIVEVMLDAVRNYDHPLSTDRLIGWHAALFSKTSSSERLKKEMTAFVSWFNTPSDMDLVLKSAIAHFWFVTIHPFDDGNGRIARALADLLLARAEQSKQRFYSMSSQIQKERKAYYDIFEKCQKGSLDITQWLDWFLNCMKRAIIASEEILQAVLTKANFWKTHSGEAFNERQRTIINLLFENFTGKLTSSKWAKLTKCSQDTALRDINDLVQRKILLKDNAGGRSTGYRLRVQMKNYFL